LTRGPSPALLPGFLEEDVEACQAGVRPEETARQGGTVELCRTRDDPVAGGIPRPLDAMWRGVCHRRHEQPSKGEGKPATAEQNDVDCDSPTSLPVFAEGQDLERPRRRSELCPGSRAAHPLEAVNLGPDLGLAPAGARGPHQRCAAWLASAGATSRTCRMRSRAGVDTVNLDRATVLPGQGRGATMSAQRRAARKQEPSFRPQAHQCSNF
jgi:hypothetical protein